MVYLPGSVVQRRSKLLINPGQAVLENVPKMFRNVKKSSILINLERPCKFDLREALVRELLSSQAIAKRCGVAATLILFS